MGLISQYEKVLLFKKNEEKTNKKFYAIFDIDTRIHNIVPFEIEIETMSHCLRQICRITHIETTCDSIRFLNKNGELKFRTFIKE